MQGQFKEPEVVWGAKPISEIIGLTPRQTNYLLNTGEIPAKKVGNRWVANRETLKRFFAGQEPAA